MSSYRLPMGTKSRAPLGLSGHLADVISMCPSYTDSHSTGGGGGPLLLTACADGTARLWALEGPYAGSTLVCFDRLRSGSKTTPSKEENPPLEQVQDSQLLCLDGAIAIATGPRLGIYRYQLHIQDTDDDIKRLRSLGSYKCCGLLTLPKEPAAGQSIAAVAANNAVISSTVLVASSSKRIYVWDVAAEKVLAAAPEASLHTRPLTCLRLSQPHVDYQSAQSLDLFYSAGLDGVIKLWDLRTMQECQRFEGGHVHSAQKLRPRLSPDLRYMCTPSEDGCVCVYDLRTGGVLGSKRSHRDVVCGVDLHPRTGSLVSGGFDGAVHFYRSPAGPRAKGGGRPPGGIVQRVKEVEPAVRVREVEMGAFL